MAWKRSTFWWILIHAVEKNAWIFLLHLFEKYFKQYTKISLLTSLQAEINGGGGRKVPPSPRLFLGLIFFFSFRLDSLIDRTTQNKVTHILLCIFSSTGFLETFMLLCFMFYHLLCIFVEILLLFVILIKNLLLNI